MRFSLLAFGFLLLNLSSIAQEKSKKVETINGKKYYMHTVEKGQTVYSIAKIYEVDKNDIILENPDMINGIRENAILKIPFNNKPKAKQPNTLPPGGNYQSHVVEKGQTLYGISKIYGVKTDEIIALNPEAANGLKLGQILMIPKKISESTPKKTEEPQELKLDIKTEIKPELIQKTTETVSPPIFKVLGEKINVALLLPLYLNQNDSVINSEDKKEIYTKSMLGLQFYEGFMCAADSLQKTGFNANIYTYDSETEITNTEKILQKPELKEMNLIIGPFYTSSAQIASGFCKANGIYFVSPFSSSNKVLLGNANAFKINPSPQSQIIEIISHVNKNYQRDNYILATFDEVKEKAVIDYYKEIYGKSGFKDSLKIVNVKKLGYKGLETAFDKSRKNIIFCSITEQANVTEFFNKIKSVEKELPEIVIFGLENWNNYENLEFDNLEKFNVIIPNNTFIDYSSPQVKKFVTAFREKYKTEPDKFAFMGYDVAMHFLKGVANNTLTANFKGLNTNFKFEISGFESGYENKSVNLIKIEDLKAIKVN